jgi:ABC-type transporter Mla subunit MlaD
MGGKPSKPAPPPPLPSPEQVGNAFVGLGADIKRVSEVVVDNTKRIAEEAAAKAEAEAIRLAEETKRIAEETARELEAQANSVKDTLGSISTLESKFRSVPQELINVGYKVTDVNTKLEKQFNEIYTSLRGFSNELDNASNVFKSIPSTFENKLHLNIKI